jgi:hypothetical protein
MRNPLRVFAAQAAGFVSLLFLTGCLSTNPGSASLAYVDIESHGADEVRAETIRVFEDDNYQLVEESAGRLTFDREATQRDQVMYGHYGEQLSMRVVVSIEPRRQGGCLVRADAYALSGGSETKVIRMARRPYKDLLNRVKASLVKAGGVE